MTQTNIGMDILRVAESQWAHCTPIILEARIGKSKTKALTGFNISQIILYTKHISTIKSYTKYYKNLNKMYNKLAFY